MRVHVPSGIDQQFRAVSQCVSRRRHEFHIALAVLTEHAPAKLHRLESLLEIPAAGLRHSLRRRAEQRARISRHLVSVAAAQQFVDGLPNGFAHDVPESNVDSRDHLHHGAAPAVIHRAHVHLVPQTLDLEWIFSHENRAQRRRSPTTDPSEGASTIALATCGCVSRSAYPVMPASVSIFTRPEVLDPVRFLAAPLRPRMRPATPVRSLLRR